MPHILVDPNRRQHLLLTDEAYITFVKSVDPKHWQNMLELIGLGREGVESTQKKDYMLRHHVKWVVLDGTTAAVPLVGSYDYMWNTLKEHHGASCQYETFKKFINVTHRTLCKYIKGTDVRW